MNTNKTPDNIKIGDKIQVSTGIITVKIIETKLIVSYKDNSNTIYKFKMDKSEFERLKTYLK
jgi:hypothetical protein